MAKYLRDHPANKNIYLNRNEKNMGLVPHLNYLMKNFVHGDIIVLAGGDDISLSNRVKETMDIFRADESIKMVTGQMIRVDALGNEIEQMPPMTEGKYFLDEQYIRSLTFMCGAPGMAFRREIWDTFGPLLDQCPTEDSVLRFRTLLMGSIYVSPNTFIKYRIHENNISRSSNMSNLKTSGLVEQLRLDLIYALKYNMISDSVAKRLEKKNKYIQILSRYRNS